MLKSGADKREGHFKRGGITALRELWLSTLCSRLM